MDFVSTTTGWAVQNQVNGVTPLYRTTDGGKTWTLLNNASQPQPDLIIETMRIELQNTSCLAPGDIMGARVWVKNNGQAAAGSFVVTVNGIQQTANGLGISETTALFFPTSNNPVTAVVDSTNVIAESNETNNTRSEMVPVPTAPLPCATGTPNAPQDFNTFGQTLVNALNGRNFDAAKSMMDQSFGFAFWQSQGYSTTPNEAIGQLPSHLSATPLTPNASQDLNALLGGLNPYSIMGLNPSNSQGLFVSGWGSDGKGEAILYFTRRPDGTAYWHSVLIAPSGFIPDVDPTLTHDAFCADTRIPLLLTQLKGSLNQSNADTFSGLASPAHGIDVRLWAYASPVNFNANNVYTVFTSTQVYNWGSGPAGGPEGVVGTFKDVIQPKLLEVLNAPNMETYCDNLTKVFPLTNPWQYPDMRYYNLYKPASPDIYFDFRTWLIGFEYVNGQPYIAAMVTIVWEP
jgi:CARDB